MRRNFFVVYSVYLLLPCIGQLYATPLRTVAFGNGFAAPLINEAGQVAFRGLAENPDSSGIVTGIWAEGADGLRLVAGRGIQAPGQSVGAKFLSFGSIAFNDHGQVAFGAQLETGSGGVVTPHTNGIWSEGSGSLQLVAFHGDSAPGFTRQTEFAFFFRTVLSNSGDVAFASSLDQNILGESRAAIFSTVSGSLSIVALDGGSAPGVTGVFRDNLNSFQRRIGQRFGGCRYGQQRGYLERS